MYEIVQGILSSAEKTDLRQFLGELRAQDKHFLLRNEIVHLFADYCQKAEKPTYFYHSSSLGKLIHHTHEILFSEENIWFLIRTMVASQEVLRLNTNLTEVEPVSPQELLELRDRLVDRHEPGLLEIDLGPFYSLLPSVQDPRNIGKGIEFLNRHLCDELFDGKTTEREYWQDKLLNALRRKYNGIDLLINDRITSVEQFAQQLDRAFQFVRAYPADTPYATLQHGLQELGFEPGWGNTATRIDETLRLLERFIDNPEPAILEAFVARIPIVFRVVLVAVHGWVAQEGILGRPETMGRVAYVLEQAKYLENQLWHDIQLAGLDVLNIKPQVVILTRLIPNCEGTNCNMRLEKLQETHNAWILRVPFRTFNPNVTQNWMPKNDIWAYLETFATDAETEVLAQLQGKPDLVIGNYTDGSLVAFLLSRRFHCTYFSIAHSLEKPRYLFSNLYWEDLEEQYHFSLQFTADLISMNAADCVVASSYHEIVGTPDTVGQYESYKFFTMPRLYHVVDGIDLFSPKFNVIPPGINPQIFFPYSERTKRSPADRDRIYNLLFSREDEHILGHLDDPNRKPILTLAPLNSIKNPSGLVECFGRSKELQKRCNLIIISNKLYSEDAANPEEAQEIERLHHLIDHYQLHGHIRWIGLRLPHSDLGEAYRVCADCQGIFVHSSRFEAFGLTVLESMASGLPTFATQFGGPQEIIQDGDNGFLINPMHLDEMTDKILTFLQQCDVNSAYWGTISNRGIHHVQERYNWQSHIAELLNCAKLSSFWGYVYHNQRIALLRYLETLFHLIYKPRAQSLLEQHLQR